MGVEFSARSNGSTIRQKAAINIAPFVDVMLAMLVIFMVAAPLTTASLNLDTPPAVPGINEIPPPDPLYVMILNSGELTLNYRPTSHGALAADICSMAGGRANCTEQRVFLRAEPDVPYDAVMQVMNSLKAGGFLKVGLLNEDIT